MRRGRRTRAAYPAEMRLGSNRILYVGKQEAADARPSPTNSLRTHRAMHTGAGRVAFSRLHVATLTHKYRVVNRRISSIREKL